MIAQLGTPDMKLPIRYAFTWPRRAPSPDTPLDLLTCGDLTFRAPDTEAFPACASPASAPKPAAPPAPS